MYIYSVFVSVCGVECVDEERNANRSSLAVVESSVKRVAYFVQTNRVVAGVARAFVSSVLVCLFYTLNQAMATTKALKKENEELRQEISELQKKIDKIAHDISQRNKSEGNNVGDQVVCKLEKDNSVEFLSHKYDELVYLRLTASQK
mgnify:FL=1